MSRAKSSIVNIHRAGDKNFPSHTMINIDTEVPASELSDPVKAKKFFEKEARTLEKALRATLPQATLDHLMVRLIKNKLF